MGRKYRQAPATLFSRVLWSLESPSSLLASSHFPLLSLRMNLLRAYRLYPQFPGATHTFKLCFTTPYYSPHTLSPLSFAPLRNASCKLPDADPSCLDPNSPFRSSALNCSSLASDCQSMPRSSPVPITVHTVAPYLLFRIP
ncbi:hypothetical protein BDV19DRAFT_365304 [Aspergillus venezuelensis]